MLWLVQANRTTTGKPDLSNRTPSGFLNFGALNILLGKGSHLGFQVVANEIEFVGAMLIRLMECRFSWRQGKNQPAMTRIHRFEPENVAENSRFASAFLVYTIQLYERLKLFFPSQSVPRL